MSSELKSRLQEDLKAARKQRDRARTLVLSTTLSEVRNREIEQRGGSLSDEDVVQVVQRVIKQRREAAEQMRAGEREELAAKEESEARVLSGYLPEPLTEAEVRALIQESIVGGAAGLGGVMAAIMPRIRGRFEGKEANRIAREELAQ